jgi:glycosyltransferase involved in cell wall biosynthesis
MNSMSEIAVIIPALNAAATLPAALAAIGPVGEAIVVDGGSSDATARAANAAGARLIAAAKGRGIQIAAGIQAASLPWLLLLHADTRLASGWRNEAACHMRTSSDKAAYFRFALDSPDPRARRLERMVAWRCRVLGLPYGDQGLLIHRDMLREAGGMRALPLMEDIDLIRRIGRARLT